jgi:osmotically-inducible protein OsmY
MEPALKRTLATAFATFAAAAVLSACDRAGEDTTAGQKLDSTVAKVEAKGEAMGARVADASRDATTSVQSGVDTAGNKIKDAAITTAVNAQLAADSSLSALNIDVDTSNGNVILRGTAPDATAKGHATELVKQIDGVDSVDNQLVVAAK